MVANAAGHPVQFVNVDEDLRYNDEPAATEFTDKWIPCMANSLLICQCLMTIRMCPIADTTQPRCLVMQISQSVLILSHEVCEAVADLPEVKVDEWADLEEYRPEWWASSLLTQPTGYAWCIGDSVGG